MWLPKSKYITAAQYLLPPPPLHSHIHKIWFSANSNLALENFNGTKYNILSVSQSLRLSFMLKNSFCQIFAIFSYYFNTWKLFNL